MKQEQQGSSTTETVTTAYISHALPALKQATGPWTLVTIIALLIAHEVMREDLPPSVVMVAVILSVLPKSREAACVTLCFVFGLVVVPFAIIDSLLNWNFCDQLSGQLAKITSLLKKDVPPLPEWATAPATARRGWLKHEPTASNSALPSAPTPDSDPVLASAPAPVPAPASVPAQVHANGRTQQARDALVAASAAGSSPLTYPDPVYDSMLTDMSERRPKGATDALDVELTGMAERRPTAPTAMAELRATRPDVVVGERPGRHRRPVSSGRLTPV